MVNIVAAQEIKRRGMCAVDEALKRGPVHVVRNNRAAYVVLSPEEFDELERTAAGARLAESEAEYLAGKIVEVRSGRELVQEALADGQPA
jgi:PHD/YefM family antitoxin component YafN of YafNO toxin-antitoxin module